MVDWAAIMLPLSRIDTAKAKANPQMFTDTGVQALLDAVCGLGAKTERLVATVAGAASLLDDRGLFEIGDRNYAVLRRVLWKNDILIAAQAVGGHAPRTMYLHITTGKAAINRWVSMGSRLASRMR